MDFQALLALLLVAVLSGFAYAGSKGAPWVPSRRVDLEYLFKNLEFPNQAVVYDFGSGDGRIVFYFATSDKVKKVIGYELAWPLYLFCLLKKLLISKKIAKRIDFKFANFLTADIGKADIIFCFLMPEIIKNDFLAIYHQLKPGAKLISAVFPIKDIKPTVIIKKSDKNCSYYVYEK